MNMGLPISSSGHFALIAGKILFNIKIRITSLVTEVIALVINVPLSLLGLSLFASSWKVKVHMPIFGSKVILPSSSYLGRAVAHRNITFSMKYLLFAILSG
jgi:hypothetical protein